MANTLKFGNGNWATKAGSTLAYNDESGFNPLPFDFTRASSGTVVNKNGLIETVASGIPRIDFQGNTKGALLLEPQRTNSLLQSNQFDTTWTLSNTSISNNQSGIYNTTNAWKLIQNTNLGFHYIQQSLNLTGDYVYSIYAKKGEYEGISFFMPNPINGSNASSTFNLSTGSFTTNNHEGISFNVGNGWYRISLKTKLSGSHVVNAYVNQTTQQSETGDGTSGIYIQHAQLEVGSYSTSLINTSGSVVTRQADACIQQKSALTSITQGTFFLDFDRGLTNASARDGNTDGFFYRSGSSFPATNAIEISTDTVGTVRLAIRINGFQQLYTNNTLSRYKMLIKWSGTSLNVFVNGVLEYTSTVRWTATVPLEYIGYNASFRKSVNNLSILPTALTDAEAIALTTI